MLTPRGLLLVRLARIDRELAQAAKLLGWLVDDGHVARAAIADVERRLLILVSIVGMGCLIAGVGNRLVSAWLLAMVAEGDPDGAEALGTQIVDQLGLAHGPIAGEG